MRFARGLLIFTYGLFTIAAQTLLFREFVTAFEGNDISVGVFFGAWFLWVGLGAMLVRHWACFADALLRHIESLFLLYIPAFIGQLLLITQARELAGVASYDLMSVQTTVFWAILVNAPVSLVTGVLFPVACRWIEQTDTFSVSRVYILEAVGSFAGGLAVTALLAYHVHTIRVFFLLALALLLSISIAGLCRVGCAHLFHRTSACRGHSPPYIPLILAMLAVVGLASGVDGSLAQHLQTIKWSKLLPHEALDGAFYTAQAEYLYGRYRGQWVAMREGGVCEALPNEDDAGRAAAVSLCQNPQARRVLVIGSGLALCSRLLMLPHMEEVAWAHADGEYVRRVLDHVPQEFGLGDRRFHPVTEEIRRYLDATKDRFDLIIVSLPDVTGSALNRYHTVEFYERIKASLRADGVASVSIVGGENVMGAELIGLGASAKSTIEKVFANLVLVPGEQVWLIASDSKTLTDDPAVLRDRFAAIEGTQKVFPAAGLLSVYLPDRAIQAMQSYAKVDLPPELLVNRDSRPLTHLYGLLLAARQSGASITRFVKLLAVSGWLPFVVPILIYVVLRMWSIVGQRSGGRASSFDSSLLVFSTGWVGIATVIVVMYSYETHFGSLYLHVGVISSLFMVGLTVGALLVGRVIAGCDHVADPSERACLREHRHGTLLLGNLLVHGLLLVTVAFWPSGIGSSPGHGFFAVVFILSGLCCGGYWPIAAAQLAGSRFNSGEAGSRLETADHFGACLGGLVTSLLMVPVLGTGVSLLVLVALLLANVPAAAAILWKRELVLLSGEISRLRQAGYALFGVAACVIACSNVLASAGARLQPTLPEYAVHALAGEGQTRQESALLRDSGKRAIYFVVADVEQKPAGYLFSSADFAPEVRGFGGRLNLAVHIDTSGKLIDFLLVRSNETPSYLGLLRDWLETLKGKPLFADDPFTGISAVTGATISSEAVLTALRTSARRFAQEIQGGPPSTQAEMPVRSWSAYIPDATCLYLIGALIAALVVAHRGGFRSRILVLALTFMVGGISLNAQYSVEQIATLLSLDAPAARLAGVFLLVVGVPLIVLLFGNLYCGYVCPFGAAQELVGYLLPRRFRPAPRDNEMRLARFIKYIILAVLIVAFFLSRDRRTLAGDPLTSVFGLRSAILSQPGWMFGVVGAALVGSLFYVRFWCRYLCPVGAFLSLLNHVRLLRRWVPAKWFARCEFGLAANDHLDCIYCDRCRHAARQGLPEPATSQWTRHAPPLVLAATILGLFLAGVSWSRFRQVMPRILEERVEAVGAAGQARDVDVQQIRTLTEQGRLSDKKAEYYKQLD